MRCTVFAVMAFVLSGFAGGPGITEEEMQKQDMRTFRREVISMNIGVEDEALTKQFWAMYDVYEQESKKEIDEYVELLKKYADAYDTMTDEIANELTGALFKNDASRQKRLQKFHKKIAKEISSIAAARFVQLENRINLMIKSEVAYWMPILLPDSLQNKDKKPDFNVD